MVDHRPLVVTPPAPAAPRRFPVVSDPETSVIVEVRRPLDPSPEIFAFNRLRNPCVHIPPHRYSLILCHIPDIDDTTLHAISRVIRTST
jgi:hypothetical protein